MKNYHVFNMKKTQTPGPLSSSFSLYDTTKRRKPNYLFCLSPPFFTYLLPKTRGFFLLHSLPPRLSRPCTLGHLALGAASLHLSTVVTAQVTGAHGVAALGVALLSTETVLFVLLLALVVDRTGAEGSATGAGALVVFLEFVLDADVKEVSFVGAEVVIVVLALCIGGENC